MGNERRRKKKKRLNWPADSAFDDSAGRRWPGSGLAAEAGTAGGVQRCGTERRPEPGSAMRTGAGGGQRCRAPEQYPVITLGADTVWVQAGSDFDPTANLTVTDPEDGELSYMQDSITPVPGTYTIISTVDLTTPGAYVVTVSAKDLSGAMSETAIGAGAGRGRTAGSADATYIDGFCW